MADGSSSASSGSNGGAPSMGLVGVDAAEVVLYVLAGLTLVVLALNVSTRPPRAAVVRSVRCGPLVLSVEKIPIPGRYFENEPDRWVALPIFGMAVMYMFFIVVQQIFPSSSGGDAFIRLSQFFTLFGYFCVVGVLFWPLFMCARSDKLAAQVMGILYCLTMVVLYFCYVFAYPGDVAMSVVYALILLPCLLSSFAMLGFFLLHARLAVQRKHPYASLSDPDEPQLAAGRSFDRPRGLAALQRLLGSSDAIADAVTERYVYRRFRSGQTDNAGLASPTPVPSRMRRNLDRWSRRMRSWRLPRDAEFHYPMRLWIANWLLTILVYMMAILLAEILWEFDSTIIMDLLSNLAFFTGEDYAEQSTTFNAVIAFVIPGVSLVFVAVQVYLSFWQYRDDLLRLRRGDYHRIPNGRSHTLNLNNTISFVGYQIGYAIFGFVVLILSTYIIVTVIYWTLAIQSVRLWAWETLILPILVPMLVITIFFAILAGAIDLIFIPNLQAPFDLQHAHIFAHAEYFIIFVCFLRGSVSFLMARLVWPILAIILFSFRMDQASLPDNLAGWDSGHQSYLGMLLADHYHNNPTLIVFVRLLSATLAVQGAQVRSLSACPPMFSHLTGPCDGVERSVRTSQNGTDATPDDKEVLAKQYMALFHVDMQSGKLQHLSTGTLSHKNTPAVAPWSPSTPLYAFTWAPTITGTQTTITSASRFRRWIASRSSISATTAMTDSGKLSDSQSSRQLAMIGQATPEGEVKKKVMLQAG